MLTMRVVKKGRIRFLLIGLILIAVVLIGLYHGMSDGVRSNATLYHVSDQESSGNSFYDKVLIFASKTPAADDQTARDLCPGTPPRTDFTVDTGKEYPNLEFNPTSKIYWNQTFEERYFERRRNWRKLPLKASS